MGPLTPEQQQLVSDHYPLAIRQARAFIKRSNLGHVADELESAAVLGLCRAPHYHDPSRNAKFSTFAYLCIKTEMLQMVRKLSREERAGDRLVEFLDHLGIRTHQRFDSDEDGYLIDFSRPEADNLVQAVMAADLRHLVKTLPEKEREFIRLYYVEGLLGRQVASSKSAFFRVHRRTLDKLRKAWDRSRVRRDDRPTPPLTLVPRRPMPTEMTITRAGLLALRARVEDEFQALRARVEDEFQGRLTQIDAAIALFDSGLLEQSRQVTSAVPASRPKPAPVHPRRDRPNGIATHVHRMVKEMPRRFGHQQLVAAVEREMGRQIHPTSVQSAIDQLVRQKTLRVAQRGGGRGNPKIFERLDMNGHAPADKLDFTDDESDVADDRR